MWVLSNEYDLRNLTPKTQEHLSQSDKNQKQFDARKTCEYLNLVTCFIGNLCVSSPVRRAIHTVVAIKRMAMSVQAHQSERAKQDKSDAENVSFTQ
jgi:hypothetical protein